MRAFRWMMAVLLLPVFPVMAKDGDGDRARLVRLELELSLRKASGIGEKHPSLQRMAAEIERIEKRNPEVRDDEYFKLLNRNRSRLEDEQMRKIDEGLGDNHPERREIDVQLAEILRRLRQAK